jgi:hypothetical protein
LAKDTISGDSIEGKLAVNELKWGPDCGNATEESEKDAEVEKTDYNNGAAEMNVAQILHGTADEYLSHIQVFEPYSAASIGIYKVKKLVKIMKQGKMIKLMMMKSALATQSLGQP